MTLASDTANNLFARFYFDSAKDSFTQGLMDDVVIAQVPEPSSTALLGLGGVALILRRHK